MRMRIVVVCLEGRWLSLGRYSFYQLNPELIAFVALNHKGELVKSRLERAICQTGRVTVELFGRHARSVFHNPQAEVANPCGDTGHIGLAGVQHD